MVANRHPAHCKVIRTIRDVAQSCTLLYRGFATCGRRSVAGRPADCKSAIQQVANLRYAGPAVTSLEVL